MFYQINHLVVFSIKNSDLGTTNFTKQNTLRELDFFTFNSPPICGLVPQPISGLVPQRVGY